MIESVCCCSDGKFQHLENFGFSTPKFDSIETLTEALVGISTKKAFSGEHVCIFFVGNVVNSFSSIVLCVYRDFFNLIASNDSKECYLQATISDVTIDESELLIKDQVIASLADVEEIANILGHYSPNGSLVFRTTIETVNAEATHSENVCSVPISVGSCTISLVDPIIPGSLCILSELNSLARRLCADHNRISFHSSKVLDCLDQAIGGDCTAYLGAVVDDDEYEDPTAPFPIDQVGRLLHQCSTIENMPQHHERQSFGNFFRLLELREQLEKRYETFVSQGNMGDPALMDIHKELQRIGEAVLYSDSAKDILENYPSMSLPIENDLPNNGYEENPSQSENQVPMDQVPEEHDDEYYEYYDDFNEDPSLHNDQTFASGRNNNNNNNNDHTFPNHSNSGIQEVSHSLPEENPFQRIESKDSIALRNREVTGDVFDQHGRRKAGWLLKKGGGQSFVFKRRNWKRRYFMLEGNSLYYFVKPGGKTRGAVPLVDAIIEVEPHAKHAYHFTIATSVHSSVNARKYQFAAYSKTELDQWLDAMNTSIRGEQLCRSGSLNDNREMLIQAVIHNDPDTAAESMKDGEWGPDQLLFCGGKKGDDPFYRVPGDQEDPICPLLIVAAKRGAEKVVDWLLKRGASANVIDGYGVSAAEVSKTQKIRDLILAHIKTPESDTPLSVLEKIIRHHLPESEELEKALEILNNLKSTSKMEKERQMLYIADLRSREVDLIKRLRIAEEERDLALESATRIPIPPPPPAGMLGDGIVGGDILNESNGEIVIVEEEIPIPTSSINGGTFDILQSIEEESSVSPPATDNMDVLDLSPKCLVRKANSDNNIIKLKSETPIIDSSAEMFLDENNLPISPITGDGVSVQNKVNKIEETLQHQQQNDTAADKDKETASASFRFYSPIISRGSSSQNNILDSNNGLKRPLVPHNDENNDVMPSKENNQLKPIAIATSPALEREINTFLPKMRIPSKLATSSISGDEDSKQQEEQELNNVIENDLEEKGQQPQQFVIDKKFSIKNDKNRVKIDAPEESESDIDEDSNDQNSEVLISSENDNNINGQQYTIDTNDEPEEDLFSKLETEAKQETNLFSTSLDQDKKRLDALLKGLERHTRTISDPETTSQQKSKDDTLSSSSTDIIGLKTPIATTTNGTTNDITDKTVTDTTITGTDSQDNDSSTKSIHKPVSVLPPTANLLLPTLKRNKEDQKIENVIEVSPPMVTVALMQGREQLPHEPERAIDEPEGESIDGNNDELDLSNMTFSERFMVNEMKMKKQQHSVKSIDIESTKQEQNQKEDKANTNIIDSSKTLQRNNSHNNSFNIPPTPSPTPIIGPKISNNGNATNTLNKLPASIARTMNDNDNKDDSNLINKKDMNVNLKSKKRNSIGGDMKRSTLSKQRQSSVTQKRASVGRSNSSLGLSGHKKRRSMPPSSASRSFRGAPSSSVLNSSNVKKRKPMKPNKALSKSDNNNNNENESTSTAHLPAAILRARGINVEQQQQQQQQQQDPMKSTENDKKSQPPNRRAMIASAGKKKIAQNKNNTQTQQESHNLIPSFLTNRAPSSTSPSRPELAKGVENNDTSNSILNHLNPEINHDYEKQQQQQQQQQLQQQQQQQQQQLHTQNTEESDEEERKREEFMKNMKLQQQQYEEQQREKEENDRIAFNQALEEKTKQINTLKTLLKKREAEMLKHRQENIEHETEVQTEFEKKVDSMRQCVQSLQTEKERFERMNHLLVDEKRSLSAKNQKYEHELKEMNATRGILERRLNHTRKAHETRLKDRINDIISKRESIDQLKKSLASKESSSMLRLSSPISSPQSYGHASSPKHRLPSNSTTSQYGSATLRSPHIQPQASYTPMQPISSLSAHRRNIPTQISVNLPVNASRNMNMSSINHNQHQHSHASSSHRPWSSQINRSTTPSETHLRASTQMLERVDQLLGSSASVASNSSRRSGYSTHPI